MSKIRITKLTRTCDACPSQWEGTTNDGQHVYIRYRWGGLSLRTGKTLDEAIGGPCIIDLYHGNRDGLDGYMSYSKLKTYFTDQIEWPETDGEME